MCFGGVARVSFLPSFLFVEFPVPLAPAGREAGGSLRGGDPGWWNVWNVDADGLLGSESADSVFVQYRLGGVDVPAIVSGGAGGDVWVVEEDGSCACEFAGREGCGEWGGAAGVGGGGEWDEQDGYGEV